MEKKLINLVTSGLIKLRNDNRDVRKQIRNMRPTPEPEIVKKFEYFYGPYSYVVNSPKFINFDEEMGGECSTYEFN